MLRPDAAVYALAVPHLKMRALACPAALLMFVAVGAFRGFKDTTYASLDSTPASSAAFPLLVEPALAGLVFSTSCWWPASVSFIVDCATNCKCGY